MGSPWRAKGIRARRPRPSSGSVTIPAPPTFPSPGGVRSATSQVVKTVPLLALGVQLLLAAPLRSEEPLHVYSGKDATVRVFFEDEDSGEVGGEMELGGQTHPFTGTAEDDGSVEGNLIVQGRSQPFTASLKGDALTLRSGGKIYQFAKGRAPAIPASPADPARPAPPAGPARPAVPAGTVFPAGDTLQLKRVELRDVTMGGVVSHRMLIPRDWNLSGQVQWSTDGTNYWQFNFKVTGPRQEKIAYIPAMTLSHTVSKRGGFPPQGTPPPENLGAWIVGFIRQNNPEVTDVRLIEDRRDPKAEQAWRDQASATGVDTRNIRAEIHIITLAYQKQGVPMREEINVNYTRYTPIDNVNIHSRMWSLFNNGIIAAPEADFARLRPQLLAIAGTLEVEPRWWNQMMQLRSFLIQKKHADAMAEIRRRGEMYDRMSDEQFAAWKRWNAQDNEAQRQRIQGIYEVQDYRDLDGRNVELPFHHKHVFSDGQGNYLLTNDYNTRPEGNFQEIQAAR